jgi:hypothetical protein
MQQSSSAVHYLASEENIRALAKEFLHERRTSNLSSFNALCRQSVMFRPALLKLVQLEPLLITRDSILSLCTQGDRETLDAFEQEFSRTHQWYLHTATASKPFVQWLWFPTNNSPLHACAAGAHETLLHQLVDGLRGVISTQAELRAFLWEHARHPNVALQRGRPRDVWQYAFLQQCFTLVDWLLALRDDDNVAVQELESPRHNGMRLIDEFSRSTSTLASFRKLLSLGVSPAPIRDRLRSGSFPEQAEAVRIMIMHPFLMGLHPRLGKQSSVNKLRQLDVRVLKHLFAFLL